MKEINDLIRDPDQLPALKDTYLKWPREKREKSVLEMKDVKEESAGRFLTSVLADEPDKDIRKLIRKQIFRLKTLGIKTEEVRPAGEPVLRKMEETREHKGFMFNFDPSGTRIVATAFEVRRNHFIFVNAITHLTEGLVDLKLAPVIRKDYDTIVTDYRAEVKPGVVFAEISPPYGAYLIEEGDRVSHKHSEDVKQLMHFVSSLKDSVRTPEDIYSLEIPDAYEPLPPGTVLLHEIFAPLTLSWETLEEDRKRLAGFGESTILLPAHMVEEKREDFLKALAESEPLKARIPLLKRVLEDYAYMFFQIGRFDCFQGTVDLLKSDRGLSDVLRFFVRKSLGPVNKTEETQAQPGLIVNPYEQIRR